MLFDMLKDKDNIIVSEIKTPDRLRIAIASKEDT